MDGHDFIEMLIAGLFGLAFICFILGIVTTLADLFGLT